MNYHPQSMGYVPNVPPSQSNQAHAAQAPMMANGCGIQVGMATNGGGILTHQQQQLPPSHGTAQSLLQQQQQQQHHHQVGNGYPAAEEDYGYWAPPAPRLSSAAVRAARMEALYPYQALYAGYHQPVHAPVPTPYGAYSQQMHQQPHQAQAHHHAQLEHQLMLHHQLSKLHVYPGGRSMPLQEPSNHHLRHQPQHQQAPPPQTWDQSQRQNFHSQSAYIHSQPQAAYDWTYSQGGAYQVPPQSHQQQPQQQQQQPERHLLSQAHRFNQNQVGWEGYGQVGAGANGGGPHQQEWISSQRGAPAPAQGLQQPPLWQGGFQNGEAHHYHHPVQHQPYAQEAQAEAVVAHPEAPSNNAGNQPQASRSSDTGAAPPSPDTLDRSAVPIASLGAEITWAACAALLEPSLLRSSSAVRSPSGSIKRFSATSSPSARTTSSLWTSSSLSQSAEWGSSSMQSRDFSPNGKASSAQRKERLGDSSSPDSSASSSEPGTPPSERDGVEAGSLADTHGLGLAGVAMRGEDDFSPLKHSARNDSQDHHLADSFSSSSQSRARSHSSHRAAANAATVEKMRAGVNSVLNLISPEWKWSRNDHSLMSLTDHSPLAAQSIQQSSPSPSRRRSRSGSSNSSRRSSSQGTGSMSGSGVLGMVGSPRQSTSTDPNHHPSPSPSADTSPAFKRFVHQVLAQTLLSPTAFLLALLFVVRVPTLVTNSDGSVDQEALQLFAQPPSAAPFKLLTLGVMISNKHLDDNTFLNKTWNEVTGIPLDELNRMERYFLKRCGFEITVPDEVWSAFVLRVRKREEVKVAATRQAKRAHFQSQVRPTSTSSSEGRKSSSELNASEQLSKRVLSALDEMIINLGHLPPLDLSEPCVPIISPVTSDRMGSLNNNLNHVQDRQRPSLIHHHCHSAPPSAWGGADDVFEQESGPFRPYSARASTDFSLKQSQSHQRYSPPNSAPIPSHEQFGFHSAHGINSFTSTLGYRNAMEKSGFVPELRSG